MTTITVQLGQAGDTVRVAQVTERDRLRDRSAVRDKEEKLVVRVDTVYIEKRDSVYVQNTNIANPTNKKSNFVAAMKWICFIILGLIGLIITVKVCYHR